MMEEDKSGFIKSTSEKICPEFTNPEKFIGFRRNHLWFFSCGQENILEENMRTRKCMVLLLLLIILFSARAQTEFMTAEQLTHFNELKKVMPGIRLVWNESVSSPAAISKFRSPVLKLAAESLKDYFIGNFGIFYGINNNQNIVPGPIVTLTGDSGR